MARQEWFVVVVLHAAVVSSGVAYSTWSMVGTPVIGDAHCSVAAASM